MNWSTRRTASLAALLLPLTIACADDSPSAESDATGQTEDGVGDGDGDGDETGESTGDGDGDPGDGDGDTNDGDGDGDGDTGDGDTDTGDGDTGDGDGDSDSGDGDGDSGDGDGDPCGPECCPGEFSCIDDSSWICNEDGTEWEESELCDPMQGLLCNDNSGTCDGACAANAIGLSYIGCDYYPTVTLQYDSYNTAPKDEFAVAVANTGLEDAMVFVTKGDGMIYDTVVPASSVEVIVLPWVNALTKNNGPSAVTLDGAYRLRSDRPIVVYQYNPLESTTTNDASLLFPTNVWGNDTMVASWPHWNSLPAFYTVVAHEDGTTVTLTPPPGGASVQAGGGVQNDGSGQVMLDSSDVLQVITQSGDLTGAMVSADKPVQVIGGHKCTNVPADIAACDHLEEALFPVQTLADEYIVVPPVQVPNDNQLKAQMVRIIATQDDTQVNLVPDQGVDQVLANAGDFIQLSMSTAAFKVTGSKPLLVTQYMVGQNAGFGTSDPAMVQAVTPKQFRTNYLFFAAPSWTANYVDIIAPDGADVTVDGNNVNDWSAVAGSGYSVAHVQLSNVGDGTHTVNANQGVGISVYGVRSAGSYWYPGGLDLEINPQ
ncbi:hypothetical protein ENSA5_57320 [Enhygromyxa salina]|uniref:IgGFc-binding protein N-terminal domain-containing protein n=1 Tax=Enhygromyxa salina TaxID=215803 RepID=A0A2S9XEC4_9BACT|nr:IgGFc-binding protein [Enhygromyxa salina]PRP91209.1 hypothetical protein ENSA5_57320 [Enhygromyxa salina]